VYLVEPDQQTDEVGHAERNQAAGRTLLTVLFEQWLNPNFSTGRNLCAVHSAVDLHADQGYMSDNMEFSEERITH
jgi:hypothetical protein